MFSKFFLVAEFKLQLDLTLREPDLFIIGLEINVPDILIMRDKK